MPLLATKPTYPVRYPYISHIICNAGLATYSHLDFLVFFKQCYESPLKAVKHPMFNVQRVGVLSPDNLGMVWQCNIFGHYVLVSSRSFAHWSHTEPRARRSSARSSHCFLHGQNDTPQSLRESCGCPR